MSQQTGYAFYPNETDWPPPDTNLGWQVLPATKADGVTTCGLSEPLLHAGCCALQRMPAIDVARH
jgi:hypothetical protein